MKINVVLIIIMLAAFTNSHSQQNKAWTKWEFLMGEWTGEGSGMPGHGKGSFSFKTDLDGKILKRKSKSEYTSAENKTKNEHEDLMIIYLDENENPAQAIYFDNEGHTIKYSITYAEKSIVLLSERQKDAPVFRLTYTAVDSKTVDTKLEVAPDGENFKTYIEGKSVRKK